VEGSAERRLAAILHADVAGYSRLMASDEDATVRSVGTVRGIVEGLVRQHRGRLVDFTGDAFLAEFPSAVDAVSMALATQRECEAALNGRLSLRLGVHVGEVRVEGERIYGDPIHVAARLQTLAEPGGVCVSAAVQEQLAGRLVVRLRDLGPQALKNLARPVQAFAVSEESRADAPAPVPGFSGRPAIAVLAFVPFGGDPEQEYLADGIAEDLLTRLATWRDFPVIARNSSFAYKGRSVDVKQIGRELGVSYLIEGSVRRGGSRVRVTAQLIDARSGHHLWAERYDRELADVFAIQDEIVEAVVARVYPEVVRAERERARRADPTSLSAWESVVLARWHREQWTREHAARARELARRALELDPGNADAVQILSAIQIVARVSFWEELIDEDRGAVAALARRAMEISGESWQALLALGQALSGAGDFERGLAALRRAVELNPSSGDALVQLGNALARAGRPEEALPLLETAARLDPEKVPTRAAHLRILSFQVTCLAAGRLEEALAWADRALQIVSTHAAVHRVRAVTLAELGRLEEGRAAVAEMLRLAPGFRLSRLEESIPASPALLPRYVAGLRKLGVPE
jgi:adenylate cyclase